MSFDDWVDFLERERNPDIPTEISLTLDHEESIVEGAIIYKLRASYSGKAYSGRRPLFQKIYGGFLESDGTRRRMRCHASAERKLKQDLMKLSKLGIEVLSDSATGTFPIV